MLNVMCFFSRAVYGSTTFYINPYKCNLQFKKKKYFHKCVFLFRWYIISDMTKSRSAAGVGVLNGEIFAVGGHDGLQIFNSVSNSLPTGKSQPCTFAVKALWYRTFKKLDCSLPDLKPAQNVPKHQLFTIVKFHEKING